LKGRNKRNVNSERRPLRTIRIPPWGKEYRAGAGEIRYTQRLTIRSSSVTVVAGGILLVIFVVHFGLWRTSIRWRCCTYVNELKFCTNKALLVLCARVSRSDQSFFWSDWILVWISWPFSSRLVLSQKTVCKFQQENSERITSTCSFTTRAAFFPCSLSPSMHSVVISRRKSLTNTGSQNYAYKRGK
jgi:hypothetical protein